MSEPTKSQRIRIVNDSFGKFPMRIEIHLCRDNDGKYGLMFYKNKSKIKIENYRLSALKKWQIGGSCTPLEVDFFRNFDELEKRLDELDEIWVKGS